MKEPMNHSRGACCTASANTMDANAAHRSHGIFLIIKSHAISNTSGALCLTFMTALIKEDIPIGKRWVY